MNADTFFQFFDLLAEAPSSVVKLRELILQLAIQGKLGTQNPADEPASKFVDKVILHKQSIPQRVRVASGEPAKELVEPFPIPASWSWQTFGTITICRDGDRVPIERSARASRTGKYDYYGASGVIDKIDDFLFDKPLLLIGEDGANLVNRSTPIAFIAHGKYWVNNHAHVLDGITHEFLQYLEVYINAIDLKPYVTGTAQPKMNQAKMNSIPIAVPPEAEQRRIVSKVDELLGLCDELETRQGSRRELRERLVQAALDQLLASRDPADFATQWQRIQTHFDILFDTPEAVASLRQAIFQLAVQGQLVSQNPNDEPADELLARVDAEKKLLEESGGCKLQPPMSPVADWEVLYPIPNTWKWVRASEVSYPISSGSTPDKSVFQSSPQDGVPYLKVYNIRNQRIDFDYCPQYISQIHHTSKMKRSILVPGMVVLNIVGPPLGKTAVIPATFPEWNCNQAIAFFRFVGDIVPEYIHTYFRAGLFLKNIDLIGTAGQDNISVTKCKNIVIPLPPVAEQKRIVSKVTELLSQCDILEAKLTQAQSAGNQLLSNAVHDILKFTPN